MSEQIFHTLEPVFDKDSKILILGSFPSVKSREAGFYYYHPQNRFWRVIASLAGCTLPITIADRKLLLRKNKIAVWDVINSCDIEGSSDSSIKNVVPTDLRIILDKTEIVQLYANGGKAYELYMRYTYPSTGRKIIKLPSTSPANAAYSLEKLIEEWKIINIS